MIFRTKNKEYKGITAVEIVNQMACDSVGFSAKTVNTFQEFLKWSLNKLSDRLSPRELDLSERLSDEGRLRAIFHCATTTESAKSINDFTLIFSDLFIATINLNRTNNSLIGGAICFE